MSLSTTDQIKIAASQLFATKGYDGTSIRDIAETAGVNVSAVNYHFGSKAGLFITLMTEFANGRLGHVFTLLEAPKSEAELNLRLELFIQEIIQISIDDDNINKIVHHHIDLFASMAPDAFKETFVKLTQRLEDFFKAAQKNGLVRKSLSARILAQVMFGSLSETIRTNELRTQMTGAGLKSPKYRKEYVQNLVEIITSANGADHATSD